MGPLRPEVDGNRDHTLHLLQGPLDVHGTIGARHAGDGDLRAREGNAVTGVLNSILHVLQVKLIRVK